VALLQGLRIDEVCSEQPQEKGSESNEVRWNQIGLEKTHEVCGRMKRS
jgi:hypothetical protein